MGVKVATGSCFQWSQPIVPHSPSSSRTLAPAMSSPSSKRRWRLGGAGNGAFVCRYVQGLDGCALFGAPSSTPMNLHSSRSCDFLKQRRARTLKRASSDSLDAFSDEEFSKKIQELALKFQLSDVDGDSYDSNALDSESEIPSGSGDNLDSESEFPSGTISEDSLNFSQTPQNFSVPRWEEEIQQEPPDWLSVPPSIERKANSVDIPLSLRIIKKKMQWQEGFREAGESAYCSVKKAFSSMVFIIRELHSHSLLMREFLFTEDLQGILVRVQKEIHASFVWLFQQVFSHTPTLMMYVMILLANFTVYSMASNAAITVSPLPTTCSSATESVSVVEVQDQKNEKFDSTTLKTFSTSSSDGKSTSIGGNNGGGGKFRPVGSGSDGGDGWFDQLDPFSTILPEGASQLSSMGTTDEAESVSVSGQVDIEEELNLWNSILSEASKMQGSSRDESLDHETMQKLVSPISAEIEPDNYEEYFRTDLLYQTRLSTEPNNPLLLVNYAQFLYLVVRDYDRAEEYFKRAIAVEPPDAEAYGKYAGFLWRVRNDLWAAEETFLEAISADPTSSHHAACYAHFLWNTGGEDTCFPLSTPDDAQDV